MKLACAPHAIPHHLASAARLLMESAQCRAWVLRDLSRAVVDHACRCLLWHAGRVSAPGPGDLEP
eukprot:1868444-Pleurochrysis_carterae.AAC.1